MTAIQTSNAGETKSSDNLSAEEFISSRVQQTESENANAKDSDEHSEDAEYEESYDAESQIDEEADESSELEEAEESEYGDEESEPEEEVEANRTGDIDLLDLEPEQIQELAAKARSRLLDDVGRLRKENRELAAKLQQAQTAPQVEPKAQTIPPDKSNRYWESISRLKSPDEVKAKIGEIESVFEATSQAIKNYPDSDYMDDDEIEIAGKRFIKRDIKTLRDDAMQALVKHLPAQERFIAERAQVEAASTHYLEAAMKEVPEIDDSESEVGKFYHTLVSDPLVERVKREIPALGAQIEYILAHAARSIRGKGYKVPKGAGNKLKVKMPSSPVGSASGSFKPSAKKQLAEAQRRAETSGLQSDWTAYRVLKQQLTE